MKLHSFSSLITNSSTDIFVLPGSIYKSVEEIRSGLEQLITQFNFGLIGLETYYNCPVDLDNILTVETKDTAVHETIDSSYCDFHSNIWQKWNKGNRLFRRNSTI